MKFEKIIFALNEELVINVFQNYYGRKISKLDLIEK